MSRRSILSSVFVLFFFTFFLASFAASSDAPAALNIAAVEQMNDIPVHWVAAGGGIVAYGAGPRVYLARTEAPGEIVSSLSFNANISGALILGRYACLSQEGSGLRVLDLADPSNPVEVGYYSLSGTTFHLGQWGNFLFVAGEENGIRVFEFSTVDGLTLWDLGSMPVAGTVTALTVSPEGTAYVATTEKILVLDVTDPASPVEVGDHPITAPVKSMGVSENNLFVAAGTEGLQVIDTSLSGSPSALAISSLNSESVYLAGRLAYLAGQDGLHLLRVGLPAAATISVSVNDNFFSPDPVNVNVGDTVKWNWAGANPHSTTSGTNCTSNGPGSDTWDSPIQTSGSFTFTFDTAGAFPYFCRVHCLSGMVGTVNVSAGPPSGINISIVPSFLDFGNVTTGQQAQHTITVTNQSNSSGPLAGSVAGPSPLGPFSLVSGEGAFNLSTGSSTTIVVRFSPSATGVFTDTLTITHNATNQNSPTSVSLTGTGVTAQVPDLVVSSISGPATGAPGGKILIANTVKNQGTGTAAKVTVNFFLSADTQITQGDTFIGKRSISSLAAGATSGPVSTRVTIPKNIATGTYYLGAIVADHAAAAPGTITICLTLKKPKLVSPKNRATNVSTTPTLTWTPLNGEAQYQVQVALDSSFANVVASTSTLTEAQWTVTTPLTANTSYFWRVAGMNACGSGPFSSTGSFKTAP